MKVLGSTICKPLDSSLNEDAIRSTTSLIAVSDGAGGGGLFAERWSKYLVDNLPNEPITGYNDFCIWLDAIWEPFFCHYEQESKELGNFALNKFYEEGAYATIGCVWLDDTIQKYHWVSYGDSVIFKYNIASKELFYSIKSLSEFNQPPFLVNCIKQTKEDGFCFGQGFYDNNDIFFIASDALSHYLIMMYLIATNKNNEEILSALNQHSKNSFIIKNAIKMRKIDFEDVLMKLIRSTKSNINFKRHLYSLHKKNYITSDDYSFVCAHNI